MRKNWAILSVNFDLFYSWWLYSNGKISVKPETKRAKNRFNLCCFNLDTCTNDWKYSTKEAETLKCIRQFKIEKTKRFQLHSMQRRICYLSWSWVPFIFLSQEPGPRYYIFQICCPESGKILKTQKYGK